MKCTNCHNEIPENMTVCPTCGHNAADTAPKAVQAPKLPRKQAVMAAAAAAVLLAGVAFANRKPTVDLNKYVTLSAEGYNSLGKLDVEFDTAKLEKDYGKKLASGFKKAMNAHKDETLGLSNLTAAIYDGAESQVFAEYCATGKADKTSGLSNGEVVTYHWNDTADTAEEMFGVKVKCHDITYTVSGLDAVDTFDAFDGVSVEFSGTSPNGKATVNCLPGLEESDSLYYTLDTDSSLKNGDTVTLSVSSNRNDFGDCIEEYGAIPAETEKQFTVSGLDEYITTADQLDGSVLESLQHQAEDVMHANVANNWNSETESLEGMEYLGNYILTPKSGSFRTENNLVTLAYKISVHNHYRNFDDEVYDGNSDYYWYITFQNVRKDAKGNVTGGLDSYTTPDDSCKVDSGVKMFSSGSSTMTWSYRGYNTVDDLYSGAVLKNVESYNHQDNLNA